jgi:DNA-binding transcriptional MerR regulator
VNAVELAQRAGLTYRQVDYYVRTGRLKPEGAAMPGTGYSREFAESEVAVAVRLAKLVNAGVGLREAALASRGDAETLRLLREALEECA